MSEQTSEALRAWFKRVEPYYPELFNTAHVICGNYEQAEYALRSAIVEVWSQNADGGMGFREKLRSTLREEAVQAANEAGADAELTWPGFPETDRGPIHLACRERIEVQRALMLRYGLNMPVKRIARLMRLPTSEIRVWLDRFESRSRRSLPAQQSGRFTALFTQAAQQQLASRKGIPHPAGVYRAFEAEASGLEVSEHHLSKLFYRVLVLGMALICAAMFWLFAVLVQSPQIKADPAPAGDAGSNAVATEPGDWSAAGASVETTYQTEAPAQ